MSEDAFINELLNNAAGSAACSIQLTDRVIVTGTDWTLDRVAAYTGQGWAEDLPSLNTGRVDHACGHYVNTDNQMVAASGQIFRC